MTRINVVPVTELCDQHLLAEHRELTRIPNAIASGRAKVNLDAIPKRYTLGKGHVTFFYDKLWYLEYRYMLLNAECKRRGFSVQDRWPTDVSLDNDNVVDLWNLWQPDEEALRINRERIAERLEAMKPRWTAYK